MYTELRERYLGKINSKLDSVNKNLKYLLDVDSKFFNSIKNKIQTGGAQPVKVNKVPVNCRAGTSSLEAGGPVCTRKTSKILVSGKIGVDNLAKLP